MVRLRAALEILQVATHTSRVRGGQGIVPVHVALRALHGGVRSRQGEAGAVVIEGRIIPRSRGVALLAVCRESGLHVVRIGCAVEVLHMARTAIRGRAHELVVDMALRAGDVEVSARQRELRKHVVIERRRIPAARIVASLTGRREAGLRVRRIICLVEIRHMAAYAASRRTYELPTRVAGCAIQRGVRSSEGESGELQVIELCAHPVVHGVALVTTRGQIQLHVVQARGLGIDKVSLVAREARRRQPLELAHCCALVAGITIQCSVCPNQREPVDVLINLLNGYVPALDCMALLAVCAHLPLVDIRVAGRALGSDIRED